MNYIHLPASMNLDEKLSLLSPPKLETIASSENVHSSWLQFAIRNHKAHKTTKIWNQQSKLFSIYLKQDYLWKSAVERLPMSISETRLSLKKCSRKATDEKAEMLLHLNHVPRKDQFMYATASLDWADEIDC
jgi:hypothetical protein